MERVLVFTEKDMELLQKIEEYQQIKAMSFDDAVKELCKAAITVDERLTWGEI